jgi:hypothetical protein
MKSYLHRTSELAEIESKKLGCEGTHRVRKNAWKPCKSNSELQEKINSSKEELDELIDFDGTMSSDSVPILDPMVSAKGSEILDKIVAMSRQTQDPLTRGYRTYVGEDTANEIDMSKAFGWDETWQELDFDDTVNILYKKLGLDKDDAEDRAEEFGLQDDKEEIILKEKKYSVEEVSKMVEDIILKKTEGSDKSSNGLDSILKRNIRSLKNMADAQGISMNDLIKMLENE